jgi:glycosyltransferase involved in cell wall biosynthesis
MRLAFLTHEPFYPPSGGGSAEAVYLVEEFVRRGHEVHLFCPAINDATAVAKRFGVTLHEFKTWQMGRYASLRNFKYLLYPFALQRMVLQAAGQIKFDLLLSQHTISAVAAGKLRTQLRVPVVMNFLDYLTGFMETWPAWIAPKPFINALKNYELSLPLRYQTDGVMTVSDVLADYFADSGYPRTRLHPIFYGYDAELFKPAAQPVAGNPVVVMHGSFDHHHLGRIATEAVLGVHRQRPEVEFKFVGKQTTALTTLLQRLAATAPRLRATSTGFVPYTEVGKHLACASVGIVPYEESVGTHCAFVAKAVEYLGAGVPVVSTPLQNLRRYFHDEPAIRFAGFDGKSFGDQILSWLNEPAQRRWELGRAASERVKTALDWRAISHSAVDFTEAVQQGRVGGPHSQKNIHSA